MGLNKLSIVDGFFVYVRVCTHQVLDDLLYLGLSLFHLLRWPLQTDALLAIRKLYVNLHTHTQIKTNQSNSVTLPSLVSFSILHHLLHDIH